MELIVRRKFDAAHQLVGYDGPCANLHGHTWRVEVVLTGHLQDNGMVLDFKIIKSILDEVLPDHRFINEVFPDIQPTAENLAVRLKELLGVKFAWYGTFVKSVTVWESEDAGARV